MTEVEKIIREAWPNLSAGFPGDTYADGSFVITLFPGDRRHYYATEEMGWSAMLSLTRDRQEQVRLLDEELITIGACVIHAREDGATNSEQALLRSIKRLQETRKTLAQGMSGKEREECGIAIQ